MTYTCDITEVYETMYTVCVCTWKLCGFPSLSWMRFLCLALWRFHRLVQGHRYMKIIKTPNIWASIHSCVPQYLLVFGCILVLTAELPG